MAASVEAEATLLRRAHDQGVPILGIVENMAVHVCSQCGHAEHIFGAEGGKKMAQAEGMTYLGALPLSMAIRVQADSGMPSVASEPDGEVAGIYKAVARQVAVKIAAKAKDFSSKFPSIKIGKAKMHVPGRCREIKKTHTFETYPTTHFFANGKLLLAREGVVEPAELAALIADHLLK